MHLPAVANPSSSLVSYIANIIAGTIEVLQDFIPTLASNI